LLGLSECLVDQELVWAQVERATIALVELRLQYQQSDKGLSLSCVQLDDYVAGPPVIRMPLRENSLLGGTQGSLVARAVETCIYVRWDQRLIYPSLCQAFREINHRPTRLGTVTTW